MRRPSTPIDGASSEKKQGSAAAGAPDTIPAYVPGKKFIVLTEVGATGPVDGVAEISLAPNEPSANVLKSISTS